MEIIPAIDLLNNECVRLTQGDYNDVKVYPHPPVEYAQIYFEKGARKLHLVDLEGAKRGKSCHFEILQNIKKTTNLKVDFSGGISSLYLLEKALDYGADKVVLGSLILKNPKLFESLYKKYRDEIYFSLDVKNKLVCVKGWTEQTDVKITSLLSEYNPKVAIVTDIFRDGMLNGSNVELYKELSSQFKNTNFIASGGVSNIEDLNDLSLSGAKGVVLGKSLLEGQINLTQMEELCWRKE